MTQPQQPQQAAPSRGQRLGAWWKGQMEEAEKRAERAKFDSSFKDASLKDGVLKFGRKRSEIVGANAEADLISNAHKMSLGRVAGGAVLLGPVGAILGGLAKKDKSRAFLLVVGGDGQTFSVDFHAKELTEAKAFAAKVNAASAHLSQQ